MPEPGADRRKSRQMKLGLMLQQAGHHIAAWLHPESWMDTELDFTKFVRLAKMAEDGLFDFVFEADSLSGERFTPQTLPRSSIGVRIEPMTLLTALAAATREIGLVCTATTTYDQPYLVARRFASLDHLSGGRAGWNVVTSAHANEARNFGGAVHPPKEVRYRRAREFVDVVCGLWDSFDEGALTFDRAQAQFYDPDKLHVLNHEGEFFRVRGPLMIPRSPQGRPIVVQAGASDDGRQLAGETAEVVFTAQQTFEDAAFFYGDVKRRAMEAGRDPDTVLIMPGFGILVRETQAEAEEVFQQLQDLINPDVGVSLLSRYLGTDMSAYDIDGPVPDLPSGGDAFSRTGLLLAAARRDGLTIRQLYQKIAGGRGHFQLIGSVKHVADEMERWFTQGAADGFNVIPPIFPTGVEQIVRHLIPELQRRGLFRTAYEGKTLRQKLGLPIPPSRHSAQ